MGARGGSSSRRARLAFRPEHFESNISVPAQSERARDDEGAPENGDHSRFVHGRLRYLAARGCESKRGKTAEQERQTGERQDREIRRSLGKSLRLRVRRGNRRRRFRSLHSGRLWRVDDNRRFGFRSAIRGLDLWSDGK